MGKTTQNAPPPASPLVLSPLRNRALGLLQNGNEETDLLKREMGNVELLERIILERHLDKSASDRPYFPDHLSKKIHLQISP